MASCCGPVCRAAKQNLRPDLTGHPPDRLPGRRAIRPPPPASNLVAAMSSAAHQAQPPAEMIKNTVALTLVTPAGAGAGQKTPLISLQSSIPQDTNSVSMALMPDRWNPASTSVSVSVTAHHAGYESSASWLRRLAGSALRRIGGTPRRRLPTSRRLTLVVAMHLH